VVPLQILSYAATALTFSFFAVGSILDLRTREVPDRVWLLYGPLGAVLTFTRLLVDPSGLFVTIISAVLTALISVGLFYLGIFGGADAKAMICLGVTVPVPPAGLKPLIGFAHPFYPIVVLVVGYVCSASVAVWLLTRNIIEITQRSGSLFAGLGSEPWWRKGAAVLTGYRTEVPRLASTFYLYPMEEVVEDSTGARRRLRLFLNAEADRDRLVSTYIDSLSKVGSPSRVWVTPGLPLLVFLFFAILITLILGDPIFGTLRLLTVATGA